MTKMRCFPTTATASFCAHPNIIVSRPEQGAFSTYYNQLNKNEPVWPQIFSEVLLGKCPTRMRLEVFLERNSFLSTSKSNSNLSLPRPVLRRMRTTPGVVPFESYLEIGCHPYVTPGRFRYAAKYVNIIKFRIHSQLKQSSPKQRMKSMACPGVARSKQEQKRLSARLRWRYAGTVFAYSNCSGRRLEAGGFEPQASHLCNLFNERKLMFKSFSYKRLDLSHALSAFIRIYQNLPCALLILNRFVRSCR